MSENGDGSHGSSEDDAAPAGRERVERGPGLTPPSLTGAGRRFLSDLIVELGFVDADTVASAVEAARRPGLTVEKVLLEQGALSEDQLARALAERYGLDHMDLARLRGRPLRRRPAPRGRRPPLHAPPRSVSARTAPCSSPWQIRPTRSASATSPS